MTETDQIAPEAESPINQSQEIVVRANYELFILALVVLQIINSIMLLLIRAGAGKVIPITISSGVAIFLIGDALYRILKWKHHRRLIFFRYYGYLLLLGSLPIPFIAILRLVWFRIVTAKLRRADIASIPNVVIRKRAQSAMLGVVLAAIVVLEFSSLLIIRTEAGVDGSNIKTAGDALWWALVTMATVGYGDKYPVTPSGRLIAVVAMSVGVGIFTVLTSFMAEVFTRPRRAQGEDKVDVELFSQNPRASLHALRELIDHQEETYQASLIEIHAKLDELERRLLLETRRANAQKTPPENASGSDLS
jgi:voltage-gated potassium channel